jgi:hypothetical protein
MRLRVGLAVLALLAGSAISCSDDESSSDNTTTTANRGFEVDTPEGQVSLSLSGELPPNWPSDFPIPEGAEPAGSGSLGGAGSTGFVGVYSTSESPADTYAYFRDSAGLTVSGATSLGSGDTYLGNVAFSGDPSGSVTVIPSGGETLIIVVLSQSSGTTVAP